jgi:hypothetical protein
LSGDSYFNQPLRMFDLQSFTKEGFKAANSAVECFGQKDASSAKTLMRFFEPAFSAGSQVSGDMFSSPAEREPNGKLKPGEFHSAEFPFPEPAPAEQENKPHYNYNGVHGTREIGNAITNTRDEATENTDEITENLDPLRYVDLQLEILKQLARNNDRYLDSVPFDPRYKPMRDAAEQIRRQDRETFRISERKVRDGLDTEARYAGMSGSRITARYGDPNYVRQQAIADRYKQLEEYSRQFR